MKHIKEYSEFINSNDTEETYESLLKKIKKDKGERIKADIFGKIKRGKIIFYKDEKFKVIENDGFIMKIKSKENKEELNISLGLFNQYGEIR